MRKSRILLLVHETLLPPDDVSGLTPQQHAEVRTEHDVMSTLRERGHEVVPIGVLDELATLRRALQEFRPKIVFNLLEEFHGLRMFDQNVVSYLELARTAYTGCNPRGLIISRDKALSKKILSYHRLGAPAFFVCKRGRRVRRPKKIGFPLIVKSLVEEASRGISEASVVHNDDKLLERVSFIHESIETDAIVEQYIEGRELYVGMLGNERLTVLPPWELLLENLRADAPYIATRAAKWDLGYQERRGVAIGPAENLSEEIRRRIERTAKRTYRALNLTGYARIDFRLSAGDQLYFLEANANPDIQRDGEFASAALDGGFEYPDLLERVMALGQAYMRALKRAMGGEAPPPE